MGPENRHDPDLDAAYDAALSAYAAAAAYASWLARDTEQKIAAARATAETALQVVYAAKAAAAKRDRRKQQIASRNAAWDAVAAWIDDLVDAEAADAKATWEPEPGMVVGGVDVG